MFKVTKYIVNYWMPVKAASIYILKSPVPIRGIVVPILQHVPMPTINNKILIGEIIFAFLHKYMPVN